MDHLKPGQFLIGDECVEGVRHYVRRHEDGRVEAGHVATLESGKMRDRARGYIELEPTEPGCDPRVRRVKQDIPYTSRGPRTVSTDAYRNGWDAVYGRKELN